MDVLGARYQRIAKSFECRLSPSTTGQKINARGPRYLPVQAWRLEPYQKRRVVYTDFENPGAGGT